MKIKYLKIVIKSRNLILRVILIAFYALYVVNSFIESDFPLFREKNLSVSFVKTNY